MKESKLLTRFKDVGRNVNCASIQTNGYVVEMVVFDENKLRCVELLSHRVSDLQKKNGLILLSHLHFQKGLYGSEKLPGHTDNIRYLQMLRHH